MWLQDQKYFFQGMQNHQKIKLFVEPDLKLIAGRGTVTQ